jgi:hypothetical protein
MNTGIKLVVVLILFSCQRTPKQLNTSSNEIDSSLGQNEKRTVAIQAPTTEIKNIQDSSPDIFMAMLKEGIDSVNATINDSITFIATRKQLILYWNDPQTAIIADGRYGYIPPEELVKVDSTCFKFNFSKRKFIYSKDDELYQSASANRLELNELLEKIHSKDSKALMQFFNLLKVVDGASVEEFYNVFWAMINLWTDEELSTFINTLNETDRKEFCSLLIESSYYDPLVYYEKYYPKTLIQIEKTR